MGKALEALHRVKPFKFVNKLEELDYAFLEEALKEYELMKNTHLIVVDKKISDEDLKKLINQKTVASGLEEAKVELLLDEETQKKLKALEILKRLFDDITWDDYKNLHYLDKKKITQEEYGLLREVMI